MNLRALRRLFLPAVFLVAGYFAVFGGEYSLFDLRRIRGEIEEEEEEVARVRARIDSLELRADSLENDPAALERIARERYGMIREGEVLYRFAEPPDTGDTTDARR